MTLISQFPEVPQSRAEWAPVYIEPMLGSGERITALIVARMDNGSSLVELSLRAKVLTCMYGDQGAKILGVAKFLKDSLDEHLAIGRQLSEWIPPAANCYVGVIRIALGGQLEDVVRRAARLTASTSGADLIEVEGDEIVAAAPEVDQWMQTIRGIVTDKSRHLGEYFNQEVSIRPGAMPTRIGYLGERIAANFDALVPGNNLSNKRNRSKARLVDLQILQDQVDLIKRSSYELMLWVPARSAPNYSEKAIASAYAALLELEEFGDKHHLRVVGLTDPQAAADRILTMES